MLMVRLIGGNAVYISFGEALGKIILTYENESGKQFEKLLDVKTTIEKKLEIIPASNENSTSKKADAFPWWYIAAGAAILIAGIALLVIKMIRSKKQREKDEQLLEVKRWVDKYYKPTLFSVLELGYEFEMPISKLLFEDNINIAEYKYIPSIKRPR